MKKSAIENLNQIKGLLENLSLESYSKKLEILSNASIGEHVRHILEFYLLLVSGSFTGVVNYDKRKRNNLIENSLSEALLTIENILKGLGTVNLDEDIEFDADYTENGDSVNKLKSSLGRELAYCVEHSIHHQALIKTALINLKLTSAVDKNFGVAYSTIRYRKEICAQ